MEKEKGRKIHVIAQSMEKYLQLSFDKLLCFKDTLMFFTGTSVATLAYNLLQAGIDMFTTLRSEFPQVTDENIRLLLRKGVYPYDYMDNWDKFHVTELPPKESFFNRLRGKNISDEEYAHAHEVWQTFNCQTMKDYHDLYLKCMITTRLSLGKITLNATCYYLFSYIKIVKIV